jgi:putative hydrolase of HD superfamily
MDPARLERQIGFIVEIDRLKQVMRQTLLTDRCRHENSAEHSWHIALAALVLAEYADTPDLDLPRVIKMLLVHDLVEIDAGDTYCYDEEARRGQQARERLAADRVFGRLPSDQAADLQAAWEEFEARQSPEALFAAALDRLQPVLNNFYSGGTMWRKHGIRRCQVARRIAPLQSGAPALWRYASGLLDQAVARGILADEAVDAAAAS